jgi:hypothetical protein
MNAVAHRREAAYWLTLAFKLEREPRRNINGLVLTADRVLKLGLSALVGLDPEQLPEPLRRYAEVHRRLIDAEGKVSAQAFVVDQLLEESVHVVPITAEAYPAHLARTLTPVRAPTLLSVVGNPDLLKERGVAICGSRAAGPEGLSFARAMGRALAEAGLTLVSGLARGSDREAMEGALHAGGKVIGIAPEGILHASARKRPEVSDGRLTILSEFAPNEKWTAGRAMTRNRTIAGLSRMLIVADCVAQGGTTDQVEVASELGIPVVVRRGKGEGALVPELARRPGVTALEWNAGTVRLPGELSPHPQVSGARCEFRQEQDRLVLHLEAPGRSTLEEVLAVVREAWQRKASLVHNPIPEPPCAEPAPALVMASDSGETKPAALTKQPAPGIPEGKAAEPMAVEPLTQPVAEPVADFDAAAPSKMSADEKLERIMQVLGEAASKGCTVESLCEALGSTEKPVRKRLQLLEEQGEVVAKKKPRPHRYFLKAYSPIESPQPVAPTTEEQLVKQEPSIEKSQLGLVF